MALDPAWPGPYTDLNLTRRNPPHVTTVPTPAFNNDQLQVPVYNPPGRVFTGFTHVAALPTNPNSWKYGRDPYKVNGMVGQPNFKNGGH